MKKQNYLLLLLFLTLFGCTTPARIVFFNAPSIEDSRIFSVDTVHAAKKAFTFAKRYYTPLPPTRDWIKHPIINEYYSLEEFLIRTKTTSFLVIRNDTIIYENYFNSFNVDRPAIVFSVSKSITTALVGIAIKDGYIKNINQKVSDFIPEFALDERRDITLENLMQMTSGLDFEDYTTLLKLARVYYNDDLYSLIKKIKLKEKPGTVFRYKSLDTAILGYCLQKAIKQPLATYMEQKLWQPIGAEYDCLVTLDHQHGTPRMYGGLAICSRDLAKIGRLYLNNGEWDGKQVVPKEWVARSSMVNKNEKQGCWWGYSNGWWLDSFVGGNDKAFDKQDFQAMGYSGQLVYVNPANNIIIVRQGYAESNINWVDIAARLSNLLNTCNPETAQKEEIDLAEFSGSFKSTQSKLSCTISKIDPNNKSLLRQLRLKRKLSAAEDHWVLRRSNDLRPIVLNQESPRTLFNPKARQRVIYETNIDGQVVGVYLDNFRKTFYFEKEE